MEQVQRMDEQCRHLALPMASKSSEEALPALRSSRHTELAAQKPRQQAVCSTALCPDGTLMRAGRRKQQACRSADENSLAQNNYQRCVNHSLFILPQSAVQSTEINTPELGQIIQFQKYLIYNYPAGEFPLTLHSILHLFL